MKTSELIERLSAAGEPAPPVAASRRLALAGAAGVSAAVLIVAVWLGIQPLNVAAVASWFWMKAGYTLAFALAGFLLLRSLAKPGQRQTAAGWVVITVALISIGMMAMHASMRSDADQRAALWLGSTWRVCPWRILALAVPVYVSLMLALRGLAPTRLALTGAAAGLMAGGLSAAAYGLYCQEWASPFVALWYTVGMAASTLAGAILGRWTLKW